jgi:hypothetical protein
MDEQYLWSIWLFKLSTLYLEAIRKGISITWKPPTSLGQSQKASKLKLGPGLVVLKMDQYWTDEQDLRSIALVKLCKLYQKAIRKRNCITCKAPTSLGRQSQKDSTLQLGWGLVVLKNGALMDGWSGSMVTRDDSTRFLFPNAIIKWICITD